MTSLFHDPCNMMSWLSFYGNVTGMYSIAGNTKKKLKKNAYGFIYRLCFSQVLASLKQFQFFSASHNFQRQLVKKENRFKTP